MASAGESWWVPGFLVAALGVVAIVAGFASGGPDVVGGLVFGGVGLAAAAVILWRRAPRGGGPGGSGPKA
jgi:hypothetical protein